MRPLLLVFNPRDISECVESISRLPIDKAWLRSYTEEELRDVIAGIVEDDSLPYDYFLAVSDDCVVKRGALEAVLSIAEEYPVVTGYCRLDSTHPFVNITRRPLFGDSPVVGAYDFYSYAEVLGSGPVLDTGFVGFALTGMSKELWRRFPFSPIGGGPTACASDFYLSIRLRDAGIPMRAATSGYCEHVKNVWNVRDNDERKRLLIGERPSEVIIEEYRA